MKALSKYLIVVMFLFASCGYSAEEMAQMEQEQAKTKTKVAEVEVYFKNGTKGNFTFKYAGELKMENDNLYDKNTYDSGSICGCQTPLAKEINAFNIISSRNINEKSDMRN